MSLRSKHIAVIGGGPCGLMAAETLAISGYAVTVYDRMPTVGRKMLMAGRGGLNLTHSEPLASFTQRYGEAASWLTPTIAGFPPDALRAWCEGLGQETFAGSSGRVFPRAMKAAPLLRAWLKRLNEYGVRFALRHRWHGWEDEALRFTDAAGGKILARPDATLLALGGASWPRLGSDGAWFGQLKAAGVALSPLRPANCGFVVPWSGHFSSRFAGMPLKPIALSHNGVQRQGELIITAQGLEGGAVYALSAGLRDAVDAHGTATLRLDLRPGIPAGQLARKLSAPRASQSFSSYMRRAGLSPLIVGLLREVVSPDMLRSITPAVLADLLKSLPVTLTATAGLARAISTAGGIKRSALNDDFMLNAIPGVFVAGEMLDWEAPTGGYLLQACFGTAIAAAKGILAYCEAR